MFKLRVGLLASTTSYQERDDATLKSRRLQLLPVRPGPDSEIKSLDVETVAIKVDVRLLSFHVYAVPLQLIVHERLRGYLKLFR
jgi:hypothetical protein